MNLFFLFAFLALVEPQTAQSNAILEGRVLNAASGDPIPNVQVTLTKSSSSGTALSADAAAALESLQTLIGQNPGLPEATIDNLRTSREQALGLPPGTLTLSSQNFSLTPADGHFSFKDLPPGKYTVRASLDGYYGPPANGFPSTSVSKQVAIEAQKPSPVTDFYMIKGGVISGRIRDPNGKPVSGVFVGATRVTYSGNGRPQWTEVNSKATDDRGEYRIFWVAPGEYYVGITPRPISTIPGPQDSWARTFFPGVSDPASATALSVKDGSEVAGIDFTIQTLATTGTYKISGKAINPLAVPNPTTGAIDRSMSSFVLSPREPGILDSINPPSVQNSLPASARANGEFEIRNVRPGSYDLIPYFMTPQPVPLTPAPGGASPVPPPNRRYNIDRARVDVRNADVDGITLTIQKGTPVRGKVLNQGTATIPLDKIRVLFHSQDTIPEAFASIIGTINVDANGDFSVAEVPTAKFWLQVTGLPDGAYVVDIRQNGSSIVDTGMTVGGSDATSVEIVVNANGGTIEGIVQNSGKPTANATVVLVPPASHRQNSTMYKNTQTDESGHYTLKGIPPGEYTLFAWESVPSTAWMNAEFMTRFQNRGHAVIATQGSQQEVPLQWIPNEFGTSR